MRNLNYSRLIVIFCVTACNGHAKELSLNEDGLTANSHSTLKGISQIANSQELAVAYAAVSLQELIVSTGIPHENLENYELQHPIIKKVNTNLNSTYLMVAFPAKEKSDPGTAFTIFQICSSKLLIIAVRGFELYRDKLVEQFVEASKDSSTDYFERDVCKLRTLQPNDPSW